MIEHINCIDANYAWLSFFAGMFIGGVIIAMIFAFTFGLFTWVEKNQDDCWANETICYIRRNSKHMAALLDIYIKTETLEKLLKTAQIKDAKGVPVTIRINDDTDNFGQNVSSYVSQTKEQREEKKPRFYVGSGKLFWTDGTVKLAERVERNEPAKAAADDLPF